MHRIVSGDRKAGQVGQELTAEVKEDQEQVERSQADGSVRLGDTGGPLQVGDGRVLGQLRRVSRLAKGSP